MTSLRQLGITHELGQSPGDGGGQGGLICCSPWGCKEVNMTGRLSNKSKAKYKTTNCEKWNWRNCGGKEYLVGSCYSEMNLAKWKLRWDFTNKKMSQSKCEYFCMKYHTYLDALSPSWKNSLVKERNSWCLWVAKYRTRCMQSTGNKNVGSWCYFCIKQSIILH